MARRKPHPLQRALEALGRTSKDVAHFIIDGEKVEVFFREPAVEAPAPRAPSASPYARPTDVPSHFLGGHDIDDRGTGVDVPVEAADLLRRSLS